MVADLVRMKIDPRELLGDLIQQAGFREAINLSIEIEALENLPHGWRERLDIGEQILSDIVLVTHQSPHIER